MHSAFSHASVDRSGILGGTIAVGDDQMTFTIDGYGLDSPPGIALVVLTHNYSPVKYYIF